MRDTINISTPFGLKFNIRLSEHITLVRGNSGTGKTLLYKTIKDTQGDALASDEERMDDILLINADSDDIGSKIRKARGKLLIIDNADILINQRLANYIIDDGKNDYLIFTRTNKVNYRVSPNHVADMALRNNTIELQYYSNVPAWG